MTILLSKRFFLACATFFSSLILLALTAEAVGNSSSTTLTSTTSALPKKAKTKSAQRKVAAAAPTEAAVSSQNSMIVDLQKTEVATNAAISEYAYQPEAGQAQLTLVPVSVTRTYTIRPDGVTKPAELTDSASLAGVQYQRGLSNNSSLRVTTTIGDMKTTEKGQRDALSTGLSDINITWQQLDTTVGMRQKFWGITAAISPGDAEFANEYEKDGKAQSATGNRYSGGHSITPFIGTQVDRGSGVIGAHASLQIMMERKGTMKDSKGTSDLSITGGNVIGVEAFGELPNRNFRLGVRGGLDFVSSEDMTYTQPSTKLKATLSQNGATMLKLGVYGQYRYNPRVEILPALNLANLVSATGGNYNLENSNEVMIGVAARIGL